MTAEPEPEVLVPQLQNTEWYEQDLTEIHRDPGRTTVMLASEDGSRGLSFQVNGLNDQVVSDVAQQYAPQMSALPRGDARRGKIAVEMFQTIAARKAVREPTPEQPQLPPSQEALVADAPAKVEPINVMFDFGKLGTHQTAYEHVQVVDKLLVLVTTINSTAGHYHPPASTPMIVMVTGYPAPVQAYLVGTYPCYGRKHTVMLIVDPEGD